MNFTRRHSIIALISLLALAALACQGLATIPQSASAVAVDTDTIIAQAVATVESRQATAAAAAAAELEVAEVPTTTTAQLSVVSEDLQQKLIDVYAKVNPSVVHIFVFDEIQDSALPLGTGSGFVYDEEGHVVTNNHVVAEGDSFEVVFADGSRRKASLVGTDVDSDLGVIKVDDLPPSAPPVSLSDSRTLHVGQLVIAIGNPFGEAGSMSLGIISGLGRTLESQRVAEGGGRYSLPEVVQTDAAINPGNSGGPLLNLDGEVIGVNSAISTRTGTNSGVGFSIPVNAVKQVVPNLITNGSYAYPYMGIRMLTLNLDLQEQLEVQQTTGAYVTEVSPASPAEAAGLIGRTGPGGDLIVAVDDQPVTSSDQLISYLVFETQVGQTIDLTVLRGDEEVVIPLTLGERP